MNIFYNLNHLILIVIASSSIYACALIKPSPESLDQDIKQWLAHNEFDKINKALQNINKDDIKYKSVIDMTTSIDSKKNIFIERTSASAKKYILANEWQLALDIYNNALNKIHKEPRLSIEKNNLVLERDNQVTALRKELLINRANALISYKKTYEKLHKIIPHDYSAQLDIKSYNEDRLEVSEHLEMCAKQAIKNNEYNIANECYSLSNKLEPTENKNKLITQIQTNLKAKSNSKRNSELLKAYEKAYIHHQYNKALSHLNELLTINPAHTKASNLLQTLNSEIKELTLNKINQGKELYSKKKIEEALELWKQALELDPENKELISLISRAEKVAKKIHSLEKNQ